MNKNLSMTVNSGRVYAGMKKLEKAKKEFSEKLQEIYSDPKLSDTGRKEEEAIWRNKYEETCKKTNEDMQEAVNELQNAVNGTQFTPSREMHDTIDFIKTMKAGGCLSDRILNEQLSKFKGQETNLIYLREKLKDTIGTEVFDAYTFSGYTKGDIDKPAQFIPPDRYFNQLREALEKSDNAMTAYLMNGVEERLNIESVEGKEYKAERRESLNGTSQLI